MIVFTCLCGEKLEVPAEMAGESMQCPLCMRLTDVPRLSDVPAFEDDGTVRLLDAEDTPSDLGGKFRAFGGEADMRGNLDDFLIAGVASTTTPASRPAPRYDPVTGELLLPVGIANDDTPPPPANMLAGGSPVLGYARSALVDGRDTRVVPWGSMPWRILTGWSLMAVTMIWFVHAFVVFGLTMPGLNVFFVLIALVLAAVIAAHYVNTMEDFGPNDKDKVPVLLRSVSIGEDVFGPLGSILLAGAYAFGPMLLGLLFAPGQALRDHPSIVWTLLAWGFLLFPVAVFTLICGGVWQNLAPRRMLSVVAAAPVRYALASVTFYLASVSYLYTLGKIEFVPAIALPTATKGQFFQEVVNAAIVMALFAVPVYLMHLSAAWFGLMYRLRADRYDWVLQRHERTHRTDTASRLMRSRRRPDPPAVPPRGFEVKI